MFLRNYRAVSLAWAEYNLFGRRTLRIMEITLCTRVDRRFVSLASLLKAGLQHLIIVNPE